jgi:hypothetical protein
MSLPYENASSGDRALSDLQKILTAFGVARFGQMLDNERGEIMVQFTYRERNVTVKGSINGYASLWLKEHPYNSSRMKSTRVQHERKALDVATIATYSLLRDWIKGQITAIECGMLSFEGAFLGQIMLPTGETVLDRVQGSQWLQIGGPAS